MIRSTVVGSVAGTRGALLVLFLASWGLPAAAQTPVGAGFLDYNYGTTGSATPTGEKPESKLWFNDGSWWGSMWEPITADCHIYRLDLASQTWIDTGTKLDTRNSKADVLWDGANQKLYLVSHSFAENGQPSPSNPGRLFRYSYANGTYTRDADFPVDVNGARMEALTLARDSTGRLWITWVDTASTPVVSGESPPGPYRVMINHSLGDDLTWGTPYVLPVANASGVSSDDLSAIIAFDGKIGVMWSNQATATTYFAVHANGAADSSWTQEIVVPGSGCSEFCSDDLMNLKADQFGRVFASIKTSQSDNPATNPDDPQIMLAVREVNGGWTGHTFGRVQDKHTRPILQLDEPNQEVYLFATHETKEGDGGAIYYKSTSMNQVQFEQGLGTPFIQSASNVNINNATSSKQNPTHQTGLVVLASDKPTKYYLHNYLALEEPSNLPVISSFAPASGSAGTAVTINGSSFTGATAVKFNGAAATFTVNSDVKITATVPANASTGKISVTNPDGTGTSSTDFTFVAGAPTISSLSTLKGKAGDIITINGTNFTGATAVSFNGTPATFTVVSAIQIKTTVPAAAITGKVSVTTPTGTAVSSVDFAVGPVTIASFSPASGLVGTVVTITGSHFTKATKVTFNKAAATFTVVSDTQISATVPATSSGTIKITTPYGSVQSSSNFTVLKPPTITSFSPASALVGTIVTIKGTAFKGATQVAFNGVPALIFVIRSDSEIRATVPLLATTGKISVKTPGGTALSATNFTRLP